MRRCRESHHHRVKVYKEIIDPCRERDFVGIQFWSLRSYFDGDAMDCRGIFIAGRTRKSYLYYKNKGRPENKENSASGG